MVDIICLVDGVEGKSLYLNDHRIAGPKPWGGGRVLQQWEAEIPEKLRSRIADTSRIHDLRANPADFPADHEVVYVILDDASCGVCERCYSTWFLQPDGEILLGKVIAWQYLPDWEGIVDE